MAGFTDTLVHFLGEIPGLSAAYLFGSQAENTATESSDVDIALLFEAGNQPLFYLQKELEFSGKLCALLKRDDVDVVVLNCARSSELKYNIVHDGSVLFDRCRNLAEYELQVEHEYHDHLAALRRAGLSKG